MFYAAGFLYEVIFKTENGESGNRRNRAIRESGTRGTRESGNQGRLLCRFPFLKIGMGNL